MAELPSAIALAIDGASRIAEIVRSMKIFTHPQQGEMTVADLATSIESTLTIARAEYRDVADVETHLEERLEIPCYLEEINQVVLNLVVNAAHAIADAVEAGKPRGRITVRLCREGEHAVIAVGDTGTGIPPSVQEHLFEQFYTTKGGEKGSGQGLALARAVVVDNTSTEAN